MKRIVTVACVLVACGGAVPSPAQEAELVSYTAEETACVVEAGTRAEADACRRDVDAKAGRLPRDAGAQ